MVKVWLLVDFLRQKVPVSSPLQTLKVLQTVWFNLDMRKAAERPRATKGEGSVKKIESGRHKGKFRVRLVCRDKWNLPHELDKLVTTEAEGKRALREFKDEVANTKKKQSVGYTLAQWAEWLRVNEWPEKVTTKTIAGRNRRYNKFIGPILGNMPLDDINPLVAKEFFVELRKRHVLSANTLHEVRKDLSGYMLSAIRYTTYTCGGNPFVVVTLPKIEEREGVALTPLEARISLMRLAVMARQGRIDLMWPMFLALALGAGLRRGELFALTEEQFDLSQGLLTIDRALVQDEKGRQFIGQPKGGKHRTAVLCPSLCKWVKEYIETTRPARNAKKPTTLLFPNGVGGLMEVSDHRKEFQEIKTLVKLPGSMSLRDCRLSHNNWIEKLMPFVSDSTRKEHMGHALLGVNQKHYTRSLTDAMRILSKELERVANGEL